MSYAVGASPLGPFVKSGRRLLGADTALAGQGGGSFFMSVAGRPELAFHAWVGGGRELYISPLAIALYGSDASRAAAASRLASQGGTAVESPWRQTYVFRDVA